MSKNRDINFGTVGEVFEMDTKMTADGILFIIKKKAVIEILILIFKVVHIVLIEESKQLAAIKQWLLNHKTSLQLWLMILSGVIRKSNSRKEDLSY